MSLTMAVTMGALMRSNKDIVTKLMALPFYIPVEPEAPVLLHFDTTGMSCVCREKQLCFLTKL